MSDELLRANVKLIAIAPEQEAERKKAAKKAQKADQKAKKGMFWSPGFTEIVTDPSSCRSSW